MDQSVLIGGLEKRDIVLAAYDPTWPTTFTAHRRRIGEALGGRALRLDHIGSTAVPGLTAKSIVDIDLSVDDSDDEPTYWLRHDDGDRAAYAALKRHLARQEWPDMNAYAEAEGSLIARITTRAEWWARTSGWTPDRA